MPVNIMIVDDETADLPRLETLFGLTYRVLSAGSRTEEATTSLYAACSRPGADALRDVAAQGDAGTQRVHEMTTEAVGGRCDGVAA